MQGVLARNLRKGLPQSGPQSFSYLAGQSEEAPGIQLGTANCKVYVALVSMSLCGIDCVHSRSVLPKSLKGL